MKRVLIALSEIKQMLYQITFCEVVFDSLLVFLVALLACIVFSFPWQLSFIPFVMFSLRATSKRFNRLKLRYVEAKAPELRDQLTTAADNIDKDNEIVNGLHEDVLRLMPFVKVSDFIPFKKLWRELILTAMLSFSIIILTSFNVQLLDYKVLVKEIQEFSLRDDADIFLEADNAKAGSAVNTDIWGEGRIIKLGEEQLNLQITPSMSEININDVEDIPEGSFDELSSFPQEIVASSDASFDEKIPKENKEIVRRYFSKIAKAK